MKKFNSNSSMAISGRYFKFAYDHFRIRNLFPIELYPIKWEVIHQQTVCNVTRPIECIRWLIRTSRMCGERDASIIEVQRADTKPTIRYRRQSLNTNRKQFHFQEVQEIDLRGWLLGLPLPSDVATEPARTPVGPSWLNRTQWSKMCVQKKKNCIFFINTNTTLYGDYYIRCGNNISAAQ